MGTRVRFSEIPDKVKCTPSVQAELNSKLSEIVGYVAKHFDGSNKIKTSSIQLINTVIYMVQMKESFDSNWKASDPFDHIQLMDNEYLKENLTSYINASEVVWDIDIVDSDEIVVEKPSVAANKKVETVSKDERVKIAEEVKKASNVVSIKPKKRFEKSDLYIQPPTYPRFDTSKVWMSGNADGSSLVIYSSLPEIPTTQSEISITTDVVKMSDGDLMNLYPDRTIQTRFDSLYTHVDGIKYDEVLGCILPIEGFTEKQVRDNIVKYPHIFRLKKLVGDDIVSFYSTIEIDGELHKTLEVWDTLPESKVIPKQIDFIKDYVVRRYLLERDVKGIEHVYPMFGVLDPYLTLFTTPEIYKRLGCKDSIDLARKCVMSRVAYKQSRNPIIRRLTSDV